MTAPTLTARSDQAGLEQTAAKHHPHRWRMHRAGIVNVWHYYDTQFDLSGGRMILRGTNGSGKSRALEMLLPFVLDVERRKMDATGSGKVRFEDLMKAGSAGQTNRLGYLWLELERTSPDISPLGLASTEHLTVGALVRFSTNTAEAKVWYFTTPLRVGTDLVLLDADRQPLSRDKLSELVGADRITDSPEAHRERVRTSVFGLTGQAGKERFTGLMQLLHTLRSPDVGNRIDEGKLPTILSDALPPLSETALKDAGERLDGLSEARTAQDRLENALAQVRAFLDTYRRYTASALARSASAVRTAASTARDADSARDVAAAERDRVAAEHQRAQAQLRELAETVEELARTIAGIKASAAYRAIGDLDNLSRRVDALAESARTALSAAGAARSIEAEAVARIDFSAAELAAEASSAATVLAAAREALERAGVPTGALPRTVHIALTEPVPHAEPVRAELTGDAQTITRPAPQLLTVEPADLLAATEAVRAVAQSAKSRAGQAANRLASARGLERDRGAVEAAETAADDAEYRQNTAEATAEDAAAERDTAGRSLANDWRTWVADPRTTELLGAVDWEATAAAPALTDLDVFEGAPRAVATDRPGAPAVPAQSTGRDGDPDGETDSSGPVIVLDELDRVAQDVAGPARERLTRQGVDLDLAERTDREERSDLTAEQAQLRAERDPEPPRAPWVTSAPQGSTPLWRTIEFAEHVDAGSRAGLEAALLAAGLLTAAVTSDGTVVAGDGQVLLRADTPAAAAPVTAALRHDASSSAPADVVTGVLERIGLGVGAHTTWVHTDGAWGNGPLRGQHRVPVARHIGVAARTAARAERLEQIQARLGELDRAAAERTVARDRLAAARHALEAHVRTAPRSSELARRRTEAAIAVRNAVDARTEAVRVRTQAETKRRAWAAARDEHRATCDSQGLPYDVDPLSELRGTVEGAAQKAQDVLSRLGTLQQRITRHEGTAAGLTADTERRLDAEARSTVAWETWHGEAAEFAALQENVGASAEQVRRTLRETETEHVERRREHETVRVRAEALGRSASGLEVEARTLAETAGRRHDELAEVLTVLRRQAALPGVAAAATGRIDADLTAAADPTLPAADLASADRAAKAVLDALDRRGAAIDASALLRAQSVLDRELNATYDVIAAVEDGVHLVELADATGRRPVAAAHDELARQVAAGSAALTEREYEVFTQFVLGGVGEELRRRLAQARDLVDAMNTSLGSIRTSHGIGVKLSWELSAPDGSPIARIRELVATSGAVRPAAQSEELIALLRQRVEEQFAIDATAGYAEHLKNALDYRQWHTVEVTILGPGPGERRRISRRAKLSQGETRFVSYVTLFAAADAYLSGLPDTNLALRMILLDDAFAKVDDRTIGELMGLLVRLDVDFVMTGHALWGTYPQVPSIDVYEVRRAEGTAAVTTHVHWDGRNKHLRAAR